MAKRINTVIIVPHSKAEFIKFSFSTRTFLIAASIGVVAMILSVVAIIYTGSAVERRADVARLQAENSELSRVNGELETTIANVQQRLDEFETRTARLALSAGVAADEQPQTGADGGDQRVNAGGPYAPLSGNLATLTTQGDRIADTLDEVEQAVSEKDRRFACTPTIAPVVGVLTDGFGNRKDPFTGKMAYHRGLDLSARRGTPVVAPADGLVVFTGRKGGMGRMIRISHEFGYQTIYGHLDKIEVEPGQEVHRGDEIGRVGNTGRSTGPHLHYEVLKDGKYVNPLYHILDAF